MGASFGRLPTLRDYAEQFLIPPSVMKLAKEAKNECKQSPDFPPNPRAVINAAVVFCALERAWELDMEVGPFFELHQPSLNTICGISSIPANRVERIVSEMQLILGWGVGLG